MDNGLSRSERDVLIEPLFITQYDGGWEIRIGEITTVRLTETVAQHLAHRILGRPEPTATDAASPKRRRLSAAHQPCERATC